MEEAAGPTSAAAAAAAAAEAARTAAGVGRSPCCSRRGAAACPAPPCALALLQPPRDRSSEFGRRRPHLRAGSPCCSRTEPPGCGERWCCGEGGLARRGSGRGGGGLERARSRGLALVGFSAGRVKRRETQAKLVTPADLWTPSASSPTHHRPIQRAQK